jgi:hypothetical protein
MQEHGAKEGHGGGVAFHSAEVQAAGVEGGQAIGGGRVTGQAAGRAGVFSSDYHDPDKVLIMPGSETASLEGCDQGPCEGLAGSCGGGSGGNQPGCGLRGYGFGDES